jgi:hypothetical protein
MISIVICSVNRHLLSNLKKNIETTIGVPYEVIGIDNSDGAYGICKAYNVGGAKARFPILCFMHEDILFETINWGALVCHHFADQQTGLLGIAGGDAKSLAPSSWSVPVLSNQINLVQHYKSAQKVSDRILVTDSQSLESRKKVVVLDGVWMCTKREIFEQFKFDEHTFKGFHGYDIDYSLQINRTHNVYVIFDILIHHYSEGTPDKKWVESAILLSKKWNKQLPVTNHTVSKAALNLHHWRSLQVFLQKLIDLGYSHHIVLRNYLKYSFTKFFKIRRFLSMGKYLIIASFARMRLKES